MISEKRLASSFTSFWRELLPTGNAFVRTLNLNKERFCKPLDSNFAAARRALINEIGFLLFKASASGEISIKDINRSKENLDEICGKAWGYVRRLRGYRTSDFAMPDEAERTEAIEIAQKLQLFFRQHEPDEPITPSPEFSGCGIVDNCAGDILAGKTLYEVKAGERTFRLVDIKQVLVYLALNQSISRYEIHNIGLLNPRMGVFFKIEAEEFAHRISGKSSVELLSDIIVFVSSGDVSR